MKPDDRIRVLAPVSGQVAAFAAVLVLGLLFGHSSSSPRPAPSQSPKSSPSVKPPGHSFPLDVTAFASSKAAAGYEVAVLNGPSLSLLRLGKIDGHGHYSLNVPPGSYQVCVEVPKSYGIAPSKVHALPHGSWECEAAKVGSGPMAMSFEFVDQTGQPQPATSSPSGSSSPSPSGSP